MKLRLRSNKKRRVSRIREKISGTAKRPRIAVYRSNKYISGQIIDDVKGVTLVDVQAEAKKLHGKKTKLEAATEVGKLLAKKAKEKKITDAVFDRRGYRYHGRVKNFADGAREGGLKF